MDPNDETTRLTLGERFRKSWFPPAAVAGALLAFVAAAFRVRPSQPPAPPPAPSGRSAQPATAGQAAPPARGLPRQYAQVALLGGPGSAHPFRRSLAGIAVGAGEQIYALGDGELRVFDPNGSLVRSWSVSDKAGCFAVGSDGRIYVGAGDRLDIYDPSGNRVGGFPAGETGRPADITAIKVFRDVVLVADANARIIRRYDAGGRQSGLIGNQNKTGGFMLPNGSLDIDVDPKGLVHATDTGRHQVTAWTLDGAPVGKFGKFGMVNPEDFVGCCNPVNLALAPDGCIVTAEKMVARVKVYGPDRTLLAVIGPEHFDPKCIHIHLAVDSKGRILAADPVRREIKVFAPVGKM